MAIGSSGRIVIELDPALKHELYAALEKDGVTLKQWFVRRAESYLESTSQLSFKFQKETHRRRGDL